MIGEGLARPAPLRLSRRRLLLGLGAGAAAAPLSGCDTGSPAALSVLDKAEAVTKAVQRALLAPRAALAPEYPPGAITPTFKPNGSIDPDDPSYVALRQDGFADWNLEVGGLVERCALFGLDDDEDARLDPQRNAFAVGAPRGLGAVAHIGRQVGAGLLVVGGAPSEIDGRALRDRALR